MAGVLFSSGKKWLSVRAPGPYRLLRTIYRSKTLEMLGCVPFYPLHRRRQNRNGPYFAFDVFSTMGLGAMLTHTVRLLKHVEASGKAPAIAFTNPLYTDQPGRDWFGDYFVLLSANDPPRGLNYLKIAHEYSAGAFPVPARLDLAEAHRVFCKYVEIRPEIHRIVDALTRGLPEGRFDLSIHYRGTDKSVEAPTVPYEEVAAKLDHLIRGGLPVRTVFLATDDMKFAGHVTSVFSGLRFVSYYAGEAGSAPGEPRHFSSLSGADKAIEALVNMVAIGRSPVCIRTSSHLSAWSKILNPGMQTFTLNRPHDWMPQFPEAEIADLEAREARSPTHARAPRVGPRAESVAP